MSNLPQVNTTERELDGEGKVLNGRFELLECIGSGGMTTIYKALDRHRLLANESDPYVAIKILNLRFRTQEDWIAALQQEAARCQQLSHPNIVKVYDCYRDGALVYIAMEYLHGQPLAQRIRAKGYKGMPAEQALAIVNSIGNALAFAHDHGIVHCDLKPANVFLTDAGQVKLIDFGIAQLFSHAKTRSLVPDPGPTAFTVATPAYASLQILARCDPDPRDDIYALACTAYELLTGTHPFAYKSALEARVGGHRVKRREHGLNRRQWRAFVRALAFDRPERTPTVAEFLRELNGGRRWIQDLAFGAGIGLVIIFFAGLTRYTQHHASTQWEHSSPPRSATARIPNPPPSTQGAQPSERSPPAANEETDVLKSLQARNSPLVHSPLDPPIARIPHLPHSTQAAQPREISPPVTNEETDKAKPTQAPIRRSEKNQRKAVKRLTVATKGAGAKPRQASSVIEKKEAQRQAKDNTRPLAVSRSSPSKREHALGTTNTLQASERIPAAAERPLVPTEVSPSRTPVQEKNQSTHTQRRRFRPFGTF